MESRDHQHWMQIALDLAVRGQGFVEPNPMVGCVLVRDGQIIGQGFHQKFGGQHAEVAALADARGARGATAYVTLEPCCHHGKTPPCTDALIAAGVAKVVVAVQDPFSQVDGNGIARLREAGIDVETGILQAEASELNRPWFKRINSAMPWIIGKWAMTLDGKIATESGSSQWISNELSRESVHQTRGRMDAIIIGIGTALADDPLLTARPPGPRQAVRIVMDSNARLPVNSRLVQDAGNGPVVVAVGPNVDKKQCALLAAAGCEILELVHPDRSARIIELLKCLGKREQTNVLVEGGGELLGAFMDAEQIDEVHCFIAPRIVGGASALTPISGKGLQLMSQARNLDPVCLRQLGSDVHICGRIDWNQLDGATFGPQDR